MTTVRTTIYLPAELSLALKLDALRNKTKMNTIIVRKLSAHMPDIPQKQKKKSVVGIFKLHIQKAYTNRETLYTSDTDAPLSH